MAGLIQRSGLKRLTEQSDPRDAVQWLLIAELLVAEDGNVEYAVELLGLAFSHPDSLLGWLEQWPRWPQLRHDFEAELGSEAYNAAWERGKSLDLETVCAELLNENGEQLS